MASSQSVQRIAMQVSRGVVVASIQVDLDPEVVEQLRDDLLDRIQQSGSRGVILDVSGLETLDADEFAALGRIIAMSRLLGAETLLAGLRPGVVSALIDTGADVDGVRGALNLDAAFELLESAHVEPGADPLDEDHETSSGSAGTDE